MSARQPPLSGGLPPADNPEVVEEPYEVSIYLSKTGKLITGRFSFRDQQSVEELVGVLNAMKMHLLRNKRTHRDEAGDL